MIRKSPGDATIGARDRVLNGLMMLVVIALAVLVFWLGGAFAPSM